MHGASHLEWSSRVSPMEGFSEDLVEVLDEGQQFSAKILLGSKVATPDHFPHHDPKHDLDLIEPGAVLGGVDEANEMTLLGQELLACLLGFQYTAPALLAQVVLAATHLRNLFPRAG